MFVKNPNLGADPNLGDFTVLQIRMIHQKIYRPRIKEKNILLYDLKTQKFQPFNCVYGNRLTVYLGLVGS